MDINEFLNNNDANERITLFGIATNSVYIRVDSSDQSFQFCKPVAYISFTKLDLHFAKKYLGYLDNKELDIKDINKLIAMIACSNQYIDGVKIGIVTDKKGNIFYIDQQDYESIFKYLDGDSAQIYLKYILYKNGLIKYPGRKD